ncbi:MAG: dTDP-4-dehydrorhamnose 3,5-epimerase [Holosporales bacterium]
MNIIPTPILGAYVIKTEPKHDERGYFCRTYCAEIFKKHGLVHDWVQTNLSFNIKKDQCRGMHFQKDPFSETKLIRCLQGSVLDALLDVRPDSPTYGTYFNILLHDNIQLYVPRGIAHGYKTLQENTSLFYMMDAFYAPDAAQTLPIEDAYFSSSAYFLPRFEE